MSVEIDRPVLTEHARKVGLDAVKVPLEDRPEAGRPGWIDMDVRWIVTRDNVGSEDSGFGLTYFPPGSRHEIHRHENAEELWSHPLPDARSVVSGHPRAQGGGAVHAGR